MKVLILGSGGREHALGWKIARSPLLEALYFSPGNPGTAALGNNLPLGSHQEVAAFCKRRGIDLVIPGPEQPLVNGIADVLAKNDIPCFGPTAAAARLEGSKAFAKEIMAQTGIPTAAYRHFTDFETAWSYARERPHPLVVKADGLAAGKGVTICSDPETTHEALKLAMLDHKFGVAGNEVVIEECLTGTEVSFHVISDGQRLLPLVSAQDHKALLEGNRGPNTGGMGTFAPSPLVTPQLEQTILDRVCRPVFEEMARRGAPYRGVLFAGLMLTADGPKVLEFNCRFGDPETQVLMPLLKGDLLPVLAGAARGELSMDPLGPTDRAAACVVLAARGYPGKVRKGDPIQGITDHEDGHVFFAGVSEGPGGSYHTNGGRVLGATAWGNGLRAARANAYRIADSITFAGKQCRRDIGGGNEPT